MPSFREHLGKLVMELSSHYVERCSLLTGQHIGHYLLFSFSLSLCDEKEALGANGGPVVVME